MNRSAARIGLVAMCTILSAASLMAADQRPELQLKPCTIELVDGTKVEGQLAVQFDMPEHLIVYSPRLATVRSFLKKHVHALTVDGKREQLNAKRALTDEDKKLLGQVEWPDEPPAKGPKPAYTTEKWDKPKQLLVWAKPGKSDTYLEPGNWLANGQVFSEMKTKETGLERDFNRGPATGGSQTDILLPASASKYQVRGVAHHQRQSFMARHITVESNASFQHNLSGGFGNLWVTPTGSFNGGGNAIFRGTKHTFLLNGLPRTSLKPISDVKQIEAKNLARKWCLRKDDPAASMEIIGSAGSGDETHVLRGHMILSDNSALLFGARCIFHVYEGAILQLQSGSVFSMIGECTYRPDMRILGTLQAGSPERPIDRDVFIGLGFKDRADSMQHKYHGKSLKYALIVQQQAQVRVFSKDPSKARLVFAHHGLPGDGEEGTPNKDKQPEKYKIYMDLPRLVGAVFLNDPEFNGVVFDDFHKGGILLANPEVRSKWKNVTFGPGNEGQPDDLIRKADPAKFADKRSKDK